MLVVADSSPINILVRIGLVDVLSRVFDRVVVPPEIIAELSHPNTPQVVRDFISALPTWINVRHATKIEHIPSIDHGEAVAICLAREIAADALLIDEKFGRRAAVSRGLEVVGTLGVLEEAAQLGLVDLRDAIARLAASDFRLDLRLVDDALRRAGHDPQP